MNQNERLLSDKLANLLNQRAQLRNELNGSGMGQNPPEARVYGQGGTSSSLNTGAATSVVAPGSIENVSGIIPPGSSSPISDALRSFLPPELRPSNVGKISETAWPYIFPINFALGTNPTLTSATSQLQTIQVPKDAGFLLLGLSVSSDDATQAGLFGPFQLTIKDNQSAQQFTDNPVPLQHLPFRGRRKLFPTPMYFAPSATISVTLSTWLSLGQSISATGSGNIQISLHGLLTGNTGDNENLSKVFSDWTEGAV